MLINLSGKGSETLLHWNEGKALTVEGNRGKIWPSGVYWRLCLLENSALALYWKEARKIDGNLNKEWKLWNRRSLIIENQNYGKFKSKRGSFLLNHHKENQTWTGMVYSESGLKSRKEKEDVFILHWKKMEKLSKVNVLLGQDWHLKRKMGIIVWTRE